MQWRFPYFDEASRLPIHRIHTLSIGMAALVGVGDGGAFSLSLCLLTVVSICAGAHAHAHTIRQLSAIMALSVSKHVSFLSLDLYIP